MKKVIAFLVCFALLVCGAAGFTGCGRQKATEDPPTDNGRTGGEAVDEWKKADSPVITDAFRKVFDKATATLTGLQYVPVAYLASREGDGTNHCVLCKAAATVPDAETAYVIVYVNEDPNGGADITEVMNSAVTADASDDDGGWSEPDSPAVPEDALQAAAKACETLAGTQYTPVALLSSQPVNGMNYRLLCEAADTVPGAETRYVILTVYADPQGNAEITETAEFVSEQSAGIANPREEYGSSMESLSAAAEAVGFSLTLPGSVTPENYVVINGTMLEVDFDGGYIRKAPGSEDISGDYNAYDTAETKTVGGKNVTLKGNAGKIMLAVWAEGDYTYCVGFADGTAEAEMLSAVNEVK